MKPSDARVRQKKDQLQQARNARGKSWQDDLLAVLGGIPQAWARLWPADWGGQPYDIEATIDGRSWGIECKHIAKGNLPFPAFRPNEVENLSRRTATTATPPASSFRLIRPRPGTESQAPCCKEKRQEGHSCLLWETLYGG